jgi:periplasmic protein CpxP/Spy
MENNSEIDAGRHRQQSKRHGFFGGLFMGGLLGVFLAVSVGAFAQFGRPGGSHFKSFDAQAAAEKMDFAVDFALGRVDATELQREQVKTILKTTIEDLQPLLLEGNSARDSFRTLLSQAYVDRVAFEQLRVDHLMQADAASARAFQALADAAEVLTLEQRLELIELGSTRFRR